MVKCDRCGEHQAEIAEFSSRSGNGAIRASGVLCVVCAYREYRWLGDERVIAKLAGGDGFLKVRGEVEDRIFWNGYNGGDPAFGRRSQFYSECQRIENCVFLTLSWMRCDVCGESMDCSRGSEYPIRCRECRRAIYVGMSTSTQIAEKLAGVERAVSQTNEAVRTLRGAVEQSSAVVGRLMDVIQVQLEGAQAMSHRVANMAEESVGKKSGKR